MSFWKKKEPPTTRERIEFSFDKPQPLVATGDTKPATTPAPQQASERPAASEAAAPVSERVEHRENISPEELVADRFGKVRSALGAGTVIQGKLSFDTPVRIDGKLSGEIFSSKALIIGETAEINARVEAACLIVLGKLKGDIKVSERIELLNGAIVDGSIQSPVFVVKDGAVFQGSCAMVVAAQEHATQQQQATTEAQAKQEKTKSASGAKPDPAIVNKTEKELRVH